MRHFDRRIDRGRRPFRSCARCLGERSAELKDHARILRRAGLRPVRRSVPDSLIRAGRRRRPSALPPWGYSSPMSARPWRSSVICPVPPSQWHDAKAARQTPHFYVKLTGLTVGPAYYRWPQVLSFLRVKLQGGILKRRPRNSRNQRCQTRRLIALVCQYKYLAADFKKIL